MSNKTRNNYRKGFLCKVCGEINPGKFTSYVSKNKKFTTRNMCKDCRKQYNRDYNKRNKKVLKWKTIYRLYGLTEESFKSMLKGQKGKCAIEGCKNKNLVIDHCHKTGKVRGLICNIHNIAIGQIGDDYKSLVAATEYLRKAEDLW